MSKEVEKMNEIEEEIDVETDEVVETEAQGSKFKAALKKYGKRIAIGAGVLAVGLIGFVLGRKGNADNDTIAIDYDTDCIGNDDESDDTETE